MKKGKPKSIYRGSKKIKQWIGHKVFDSQTGKTEWKTKRNQETKDYKKEPLKGEHLHTPRRKWKTGFKRLAHNLAKKNKQSRRDEREEKIKIEEQKA